MTVSSTTTIRKEYSGNGGATDFPITFPYAAESDIVVLHVDALDVETTWTNGGGGDTGYTISSGSVVANTAPALGETLILYRNTDLTQETSMPNNQRVSGPVQEAALDKLTYLVQEHEEELGRTIQHSIAEGAVGTTATSIEDYIDATVQAAIDDTQETNIFEDTAILNQTSVTVTGFILAASLDDILVIIDGDVVEKSALTRDSDYTISLGSTMGGGEIIEVRSTAANPNAATAAAASAAAAAISASATAAAFAAYNVVSDLETDVAAAGATETTLMVVDQQTLTGALVCGANIYLDIRGEGLIDNDGNALTIYSPANILTSPRKQIFTGAGAVSFTIGGEVFPEWWGGVGDASTDNKAAIDAAIASLDIGSMNGGVVQFGDGNYKVFTSLANMPIGDKPIKLRGLASFASKLYFSATDGSDFITIPGTVSDRATFHIEDMYITGTTTCGNAIVGSWATASGFIFDKVRIQTFGGDGLQLDNSYGTIFRDSYINGTNHAGGNAGVYMTICSASDFSGSTIEGIKGKGMYVDQCSNVIYPALIESNDDDYLTINKCVGGLVRGHFETDTADNVLNIIRITGGSRGINITGCGISKSSSTETAADNSAEDLAPIYLGTCYGINITGNDITPSDGPISNDVPHIYVDSGAEDITIGRNHFQGARFASATDPLIYIHPSASNVQCTFLVPKTYQWVMENLQDDQAAQSTPTAYGPSDVLGTVHVFPAKSWVVGIDLVSNTAVTAGTLVVDTNISTLTAQLDSVNYPIKRYVTQYPFISGESGAANATVLMMHTTNAAFEPDGALNFTVLLHVLEERDG